MKAEKYKPQIGADVFRWSYNTETEELEYIGIDTACEMRIDEGDDELNKEVEKELQEDGYILNIGWENEGQLIHWQDYWSYTTAS